MSYIYSPPPFGGDPQLTSSLTPAFPLPFMRLICDLMIDMGAFLHWMRDLPPPFPLCRRECDNDASMSFLLPVREVRESIIRVSGVRIRSLAFVDGFRVRGLVSLFSSL